MEGTYTSRKVPNMKITNSNLNCTFHCGCNAIWWPRDSAQRFVLCASKVTAWVRSPSRVCFVSAMSGVFYSCMRSPPPGFQAYEGLHADWPRKVYSHPATAHRGANVPFAQLYRCNVQQNIKKRKTAHVCKIIVLFALDTRNDFMSLHVFSNQFQTCIIYLVTHL